MRTNYVLIDYENVLPSALSILEKERFRVIVFVGASQSKVAFDIATQLQSLGPSASYVKISGNGSNALDFHVAYYIGELAASDPGAYFHIISKDTGFDPLIAHLKSRKILVRRSRDVNDMPVAKTANAKSPAERLAVVVENLKRRGTSKPRTTKALSGTINSLFQKTLTKQEITTTLKLMEKRGLVIISDTKIAYSLPE